MNKKVGHRGSRIKSRRKELNLSQNALGKLVGVSQPTISDWENESQEILGPHLISLADALKTSPVFLTGGVDHELNAMENQFSMTEAVTASEWDSTTPLDDSEVEVPLFNELEIAAGDGSEPGYEHRGPVIRFSRSSLRKANVPPESAFFVKIRGNSMEPKYEEGGEAGFNRAATRVIDGEEYAIDHDGLARFKILYRLPGGKIRISSYNSDEYPDEVVSESDIRVIGQLFSYQKMKPTG